MVKQKRPSPVKKLKRIFILNKVPFDSIKQKELTDTICKWSEEKKKRLVLNMNAYGVVTFLENPRYSEIIESADIIYPDGWGPVIASRFGKDRLPERVNVGDFVDTLFSGLNKRNLSLYLLGDKQKIVKKATDVIRKKYKKIHLAGFHQGFFSKKKERKIAFSIKKAKPNLVLVGMGIPRQEYFIQENWNSLPNAIYMGVGGVFNYIAGTRQRAPVWVRQFALEWLYRLLQEPKRLWRRYTTGNIKFVYYLIRSLLI